jgi:hypothetical protein
VLGVGGRVALLRESFAAPGAALSGMFRHVGPLRYGESCMIPACGAGVGQTDFGVDDFSARLTVGKRVGPVGLLGGAGWDRFATTHGRIAYLGGDGFEPVAATAAADVHDSRWSAFVNVSRNLLVASAVAEVGWMSGGSAVDGYTSGAEGFDPGQGTLFGSIALRVQL